MSRRDEYFFKPKNRRKIYGLTEKTENYFTVSRRKSSARPELWIRETLHYARCSSFNLDLVGLHCTYELNYNVIEVRQQTECND